MFCSGVENVPQLVKVWVDWLWRQHISETWRNSTVSSISIGELGKGQELTSVNVAARSNFVHVTHGYLLWKERRTDKNFRPYLTVRLQENSRKSCNVLFFIFQEAAMITIENACLGSIIGLCGLQNVPRRGHFNRAYSLTNRQPGVAAILKTAQKMGRPPGSRDKAASVQLSSLPWSTDVLKLSTMSARAAMGLAKQLRCKYAHLNLKRTFQPTATNIRMLWDSSREGTSRAKTKTKKLLIDKGPSTCNTKTRTDDECSVDEMEDVDNMAVHSTQGMSGVIDVHTHESNVGRAYAEYLSNVWLQNSNGLCPVFRDPENMVYCLPSWSCSKISGDMTYDEEEPIFIHIGKRSNDQCAVACSNCDGLSGFWPKHRFSGIKLEKPSLGFQMSECAGHRTPIHHFKPLCPCAYALLCIPSRKKFRWGANQTLWEVAESIHGGKTEWPVFEMTQLGMPSGLQNTTEPTLRQDPNGWLIQVGSIGTKTCGFVKQTTRRLNNETVFHCKSCKVHTKCRHEFQLENFVSGRCGGPVKEKKGHTTKSFDNVLENYTTEGPGGPDDLCLKLKVKSTLPIPDVPEPEVVRLLKDTPLNLQVFYRLSEKDKFSQHQEEAMRRRRPGGGSWVPSDGLRDLPKGDVVSDSAAQHTSKTAALFHVGGVVAVEIPSNYDGNSDAVINVDDKHMFTWEIIRKFLLELRLVQTNYSRFVRSIEETWVSCIDNCDTLQGLFPGLNSMTCSSSEPLKQLQTAIGHAVHGYITLLQIDWSDLSRCRCTFEDVSKATLVYDNACNTTVFVQNREPSFFNTYSLQCDNFHHEHGSSGKGHVNCGPGTNMINAGIHTPGSYFGNLIEQRNSRVRSLEALVSSECQPRMMNTFRYWHAQENKLQLVRLQYKYAQGQLEDLLKPKPCALFGIDAINLPQGGKHSYLCRPYEHPPDGCKWRWSNPTPSKQRQMIGEAVHRKTLSSMLEVTSSHAFQEFEWNQKHLDLVHFLRSQGRHAVLWLLRIEWKHPTELALVTVGTTRSGVQKTKHRWVMKTTDELDGMKLGSKVRLSSECQTVRNVFLNWSSRNPELQFGFPICTKALKTLLTTDTCTREDLVGVRESSGQHVREILDFDLNDPKKVFPSACHTEHFVSVECRSLLQLIVDIVDDSLKTTRKRINPRNISNAKQSLKYPASESWLVTGEWFPNHQVRKSAGKFLSAKRYRADETKDGSPKPRRDIAMSHVCHKKLYVRNNLKPGLLTVHCLYCCVNVGFSFLDQPETVRTCFRLFWHRKMVQGEIPDEEIMSEEEPHSDEGISDQCDSERDTAYDNSHVEEVCSESSEELFDAATEWT
jgi:hypothetical protein